MVTQFTESQKKLLGKKKKTPIDLQILYKQQYK